VRTTIDLPDDLHRRARALAYETSRSLSETIAQLVRRGLGEGRAADLALSERTGLPVIRLGTVITSEDVRALEDDQA
jgi:predicted transcriptional regulator